MMTSCIEETTKNCEQNLANYHLSPLLIILVGSSLEDLQESQRHSTGLPSSHHFVATDSQVSLIASIFISHRFRTCLPPLEGTCVDSIDFHVHIGIYFHHLVVPPRRRPPSFPRQHPNTKRPSINSQNE